MSKALEIAQQVANAIAPHADEANRLGRLNPADITALTSSGYTALSVPQAYGGHGASLSDCLAAQIEVAQINPSTALVAGMNMQVMGSNSETREWDEHKFAAACEAVVQQGGLFNSIATEPALGSPSRGQFYQSVAVQDGNEWVINGHKTWSTGGKYLTHMVTKVSVGDEAASIIVPQKTPGVRWEETWVDVLSFRASASHDVYFENVRVPLDACIQRGKGRGLANVWFPMVMTSIYLGAAIGARNTVIQYALERVPTALGRPIATLPKIQRQIGEIDIYLQAARALLFEVADSWGGSTSVADRKAFAARMAAAKVMVTETARRVTDEALRVAGGISLTNALPLERFFRDVRAGSMQPPSGDTALELVGRAAIDAATPQQD